MGINVKFVSSEREQDLCFDIRRRVFIQEQNIAEEIEMDDHKIEAKSIIASYINNYVGTARYQYKKSGVKLERFAVLKQYRNLGVGKALVKFILKSLNNESCIYLHAQETVIEFYDKLGFKKNGTQFYEADIIHQKMIFLPKKNL